MIFVTGDTHIPIDIKKLNSKKFPIQKNLTRSDIVIVLGDFGLLWKEDKEYLYWKRWLEKRSSRLLGLTATMKTLTGLIACRFRNGTAAECIDAARISCT